MAHVVFYTGLNAIRNNRPTHFPNKAGEATGMAACFTPAKGRAVEKYLPADIFMPGRTLYMAGEVTSEIAACIIKPILRMAKADPAAPIFLWINSEGGDTEAGLAIKETIDKIASPVSTIAIGQALSMAAFLTSFGSGTRAVFPSTSIMFHGARYGANIGGTVSKLIKAGFELTRESEGQLFAPLAAKSGKSVAELSALFGSSDYYLDAALSSDMNFIDSLIDPGKIDDPKTAPRTKKPYKINLEGEIHNLQISCIIIQIITQLICSPKRDILLSFNGVRGGEWTDGFALFDLIRLVNALPESGRILTIAKGGSIQGACILPFSAGAERKISAKTNFIVHPVSTVLPADTPGPLIERELAGAEFVQKMVLRCLQQSSPCKVGLDFAKKIQKLSPKKALQHGFADQIV